MPGVLGMGGGLCCYLCGRLCSRLCRDRRGHVRQLRRKLGDAAPIVTVWGIGYKAAPAPAAPE